jgi:hypothetical protein
VLVHEQGYARGVRVALVRQGGEAIERETMLAALESFAGVQQGSGADWRRIFGRKRMSAGAEGECRQRCHDERS